MDRDRFDTLTRFLVTRRAGIGLLLAGIAGLTPAPDADAKKACKLPRKRCGKKCVAVKSNPKHCGACKRR